MSSKTSAVKPNECENVAKESEKKARSLTTDLIRDVKSMYYATVRNISKRGPYMDACKTLVLVFELIKVNAQNLFFLNLLCIPTNAHIY